MTLSLYVLNKLAKMPQYSFTVPGITPWALGTVEEANFGHISQKNKL